MQASPSRPLPIAKRLDLEVVEQDIRGQQTVVVGDPVALEYQRMNPQEFALLDWLDGKRSAHDIKLLFQEKFAPCQIEYQDIERYLVQFHQQGLVEVSSSDVGRYLLHRANKKKWTKRFGKLKSLLAVRFRGINPERFLRWLTPKISWFFSAWMIWINLGLMLAAVLVLAMNFQEFQERLPRFQEFFSPKNWLAVGLVLLVTKTLHELGHGIVYTKYGGRCQELGVMILIFMPTLYVNTSGAWKIPDKWQRAAIAAAGMYVELCLAAVATFVWWYSHPGWIQYTALNVMVTCSVSSFVFNANPLMKYDGYFIFSDLLELPNLQQRATAMLRSACFKLGLGVDEAIEENASAATRRWLVGYGLAAYAYRFVLIYGIAFVLTGFFRSVGLEWMAKTLSAYSWLILLAMPLVSLVKFLRHPSSRHRLSARRPAVALVVMALLIIGFFSLPMPATVHAPFVVEPQGLHTIYVQQDCVLEKLLVKPGQWVMVGQVLGVQRNLDLEMQITSIEGELAGSRRQLEMLRHVPHPSPEDLRERQGLQARLTSKLATLDELNQRMSQLTLRATRAGVVFPNWIEPGSVGAFDLERFSGWTMVANDGPRFLRRGEVLCRIGDPGQLQAKLSIDQSDIRRVEPGQGVRLQLESLAGAKLRGTIASVTRQNVQSVSPVLTIPYGGSIETKPVASSQALGDGEAAGAGKASPSAATFAAHVELSGLDQPHTMGLRGIAKIQVGYQTPYQQLVRTVHRLFRFDL